MISLPKQVNQFMEIFRSHKYEIYLVGGGVRDLLLGTITKNWDFNTNAKPEEILALFDRSFYNNSFGTVGIPIDVEGEELIFEVTTYRTESSYKNNRHPDQVEWTYSIHEDLGRRDFTINAIAFDGNEMIDPFNGKKDLQKKIIRAVGDPNVRFQEDALRLMRAIRFSAQHGFEIEKKTFEMIKRDAHLIKNISYERIRDEFFKILCSQYNYQGIYHLQDVGILKHILPELDTCFSVPQKSPKRHHKYDVGTHCVKSMQYCPSNDPITLFATLTHDIGKAETYYKDPNTNIITFYNHEVVGKKIAEKIAKRFKLSKKQSEKFITLVANHQFTVSETQTDKAIRRFVRNVGKEHLQDVLDLREGDRIGSGAKPSSWRFELFKKRLEEVQYEPFSIKDLCIHGEDVMKIFDIPPSRQLGDILKSIFYEVTEEGLKNERKVLIERLRKMKDETTKKHEAVK